MTFSFPALCSSYESNMSFSDMFRIARSVREIGANHIQWDSIQRDEMTPVTLVTGAKVLVPEAGVLKEAGAKLLGAPEDFAASSADNDRSSVISHQ